MRKSTKQVLYDSIVDYTEMARVDWMRKWPGMCVLNGSQFHWTVEMEAAMREKGNQGLQEQASKHTIAKCTRI